MADKNEDKLPSFDFGFDELPSFDFNFDELFSESDKDVLDACLEAEQTADESKKHATADASVAKKARFAEVAADDLNKLLDDAQAKKTKINTKWAVCVFKGWSTERGIKTSLENMKFEELDKNLCQFYAEARSKNGESYSRATLLSLRNSIERYLSSPPNNLAVKLSKDPRFTLSNKVLDARIKQLKKDGKENTTHKPPIDQEDIEKIKKSKVILPSTPHSLLKNVWFHVSLYWCRRGREGQRSLTKHSFRFEKDGDEREYVTMTHDECTKNHPGGLADVESYEKFGRMYKTDSPTDGYSSLKLYLSKVNPDCEALFQYPKRNCRATDNIWYENRPLGSNKLAKMMVDISTEANLSRIYTNHSVRATAITFWSKAGLPDRQIMAISGHRSESSLKSYHSRPSSGQLRQCSEVLSSAMGESIISTLQPFQPSCTSTIQPSCSSTIQPGNSQEEQGLPYGKMFTGCSINNLQITFNR